MSSKNDIPAADGRFSVDPGFLEDMESVARSLDDLSGGMRRLQSRLAGFLPKKEEPTADESTDSRDARPEGGTGIDALVDEQFRRIFADDAEGRASDEAGEAGDGRETRPSHLWLRLMEGERTLEVPWFWIRQAVSSESKSGAGRILLEDGTGQIEIPVDRILGVVLSSGASGAPRGVLRPASVRSLLTAEVGDEEREEPATRASAEPTSDASKEPPATAKPPERPEEPPATAKPPERPEEPPATAKPPEPVPIAPLQVALRRVLVASPSGIVRRFLRRHLEAMDLDVMESDAPVETLRVRGLLGVFWDRDLSSSGISQGIPDGLPVVTLSHQVDRSELAPGSAPVLAKPFSRDEVADAVAWMRTRRRPSGRDEVGGDERSAAGAVGPPPSRRPSAANPPR